MPERPRLVYIVTHPVSARVLLRGQLAQMREWGFDVTVITSPGPDLDVVRERERVATIALDMERGIAPWKDAVTLGRLVAILRRLRPHIVNASTTKAGLLGMLAARAVSAPVRVYLLRGLRLETRQGATRAILSVTERVASACATRIVCVSPSLERLFRAGRYADPAKICVLGAGSSNGVDPERFAVTPPLAAQARELRRGHGIPSEAFVIGFIGRIVDEKGIAELLDAFERLRRDHPSVWLVLVGADLAGDAVATDLLRRIRRDPHIVTVGHVMEPAPYYALMDILAFPSFREGFPNVPLEASAAGIPVAGFRATGVVDAVEDGQTGLLVDKGDAKSLHAAMARYLAEPELRRDHGAAGQERVRRMFARPIVWRAWAEEYRRLLGDGFDLRLPMV